jgi:hypothetical protein
MVPCSQESIRGPPDRVKRGATGVCLPGIAAERLHNVLLTHGDDALRSAFLKGLHDQLFGVEYIRHYLAATPAAGRLGGHAMNPAPTDSDLEVVLKRLNLANTRRGYPVNLSELLESTLQSFRNPQL